MNRRAQVRRTRLTGHAWRCGDARDLQAARAFADRVNVGYAVELLQTNSEREISWIRAQGFCCHAPSRPRCRVEVQAFNCWTETRWPLRPHSLCFR
jgi:hypothetical protein